MKVKVVSKWTKTVSTQETLRTSSAWGSDQLDHASVIIVVCICLSGTKTASTPDPGSFISAKYIQTV